jgi:hypothetical protein
MSGFLKIAKAITTTIAANTLTQARIAKGHITSP